MDFAAFGDTAPGADRMDMAALEAMGRRGDSELAHVTPGEIVIPVRVAQDPQFKQDMMRAFGDAGMDLSRYVVGDGNRRGQFHPRTGFQEFWGGEGPGNDGSGGTGADDAGDGPGGTGADDAGDGPGGSDDGMGDMGGFGSVSDQDIADAIGAISATDKDPANDAGIFSGIADKARATLSNPVSMLGMMPGPVGMIGKMASLGGLAFSDANRDGFVDDGPFSGMSVDHSPAATDPHDPGYGGSANDDSGAPDGDALDQLADQMGWDKAPKDDEKKESDFKYKPGELPKRERTRYHAPTPYEKVAFTPAPAWHERQRAPQYRSYQGG